MVIVIVEFDYWRIEKSHQQAVVQRKTVARFHKQVRAEGSCCSIFSKVDGATEYIADTKVNCSFVSCLQMDADWYRKIWFKISVKVQYLVDTSPKA